MKKIMLSNYYVWLAFSVLIMCVLVPLVFVSFLIYFVAGAFNLAIEETATILRADYTRKGFEKIKTKG